MSTSSFGKNSPKGFGPFQVSSEVLVYLVPLLLLFVAQPAPAAPVYNIVPLGLDDPEHTDDHGGKRSNALQLNEAGQVIGTSDRGIVFFPAVSGSAWLYDGATTINIGPTGSEYTSSQNFKSSIPLDLNEAGQVLGRSIRFNGATDWGTSAWLYNGTTTIVIGLTGSEHTRNDGYRSSHTDELNDAGQVIGESARYNGGNTNLGQSAWLYDGATTINIGLTGVEHTRNGGYKYSFVEDLNEAGRVIGRSDRYGGNNNFFNLGQTAWLYNGTATIDIGLIGAEHTGILFGIMKYSSAQQLNEAGQVRGYSYRYNGGSGGLGTSAWLYDGATTIDIGLTGSEHTRNDGYKRSESRQLNEAGQIIGESNRYNGGNTDLGQTAWLYDGATTIAIGLTGSEHTASDGYKRSETQLLNEAGQVSGFSRRYQSGSADLGDSAWLYNGTTTISIGLIGSEHTADDGFRYSRPEQLNQAGQVRGYSSRYNGGATDLGRSAWLYDGTTTTDIGLTGAEHTRNDGYKYSETSQLNEAGQVVGFSYRYNGGITPFGPDAWFFDPVLDQTFALDLSAGSDGYAFSSAAYLGDDGLVLGSYSLTDPFSGGLRAFYFTVADGLHDLGALVEGGLAANGWDALANAVRANSLGQILGHGKLTSQSGGQMGYLLTPVPGDYNGDSLVDAADYTVWRDTLGSTTDLRANGAKTGASAGVIDQADYAMWKTNFGKIASTGSGAGADLSTIADGAVPEPSAWSLALLALLTALTARIQLLSRLRC